MTLATIQRRLRKGSRPRDWKEAKYLGSGSFTTAYRVGDFVVKKRQSNTSHIRGMRLNKVKTLLAEYGFSVVKTWRVGPYVIQPYCRKFFDSLPDSADVDFHKGNVGYYNGQRVAFDW